MKKISLRFLSCISTCSLSKWEDFRSHLALQDISDELDAYQSLVTDMKTLRKYEHDLVVAKFLSELTSS